MILDNLFRKVLIEPTEAGANTLFVVSGYASPAIVYKHLSNLPETTVHLLIGMVAHEGMRLGSHNVFKKLVKEDFDGRFTCRYFVGARPTHSKLYGWFHNDSPTVGFIGSANYSQMAFSENQIESMAVCEAVEIKDLYESLSEKSVECIDPAVEKYVSFYDERKIVTTKVYPTGEKEYIEELTGKNILLEKEWESVELPLLTSYGEVGDRSGLNWGQRLGREPNQAYIPIPKLIRESAFFPPVGQHFIMLTDDGKSMDCVRAQAGAKAIETFKNNSILGLYFRTRIGVRAGKKVSADDLHRYGRSDVKIYKIDDETYYLDFSVK